MSDNKTIGEKVDKVVDKVAEKVEIAKGKILTATDDVSKAAHDISKSVKKAVNDSSAVVSNLIHNKK